MKKIYLKKLMMLLLLSSIGAMAYQGIQKSFETTEAEMIDSCETAQNIQLQFEMGQPVSHLTWDGPTPDNGWFILYSHENSIDLNWFLSDPQNYEQPEVKVLKTNSNSQYLYMNMLHPGMYELYIISDCGEGILQVAEKIYFEMGERGPEEMGACEAPMNFNAVQNEPRTMDFSWEPNDGEFYQIAWGPFGMEMHEGFFNDPQVGTIITIENPTRVEFRQPGADEQKSIFLRKYCGGSGFSEWVVPNCATPSELQANVTDNEVQLNWQPADGTNAWQLVYAPAGFDPNAPDPNLQWANIYDSPNHSIPNVDLQQGITYEFYVRTICFGSVFGDWFGPGEFSTVYVPCDPVQDISVSHITHQSADIRWVSQSGETNWTVFYSLAPFSMDNALSMTVTQEKAILMGLAESSTYEFVVAANCPSGESTNSEIYSFTTVEGEDLYCIPYFLTGCTYDFIDHMIIDGENESRIYDLNTGCTDSNYINKTDLSVEVAQGNQYYARVYKGNSNISGDHLAIWIDFNDDGIFDNETEKVGDGSMIPGGFTDVNFTIPADANPGAHRMRTMLAFQAYSYMLEPCNDGANYSTNGEVHDYTIHITAVEDCTSANAGEVMGNILVCPNDDFTLITEGASQAAAGLVRKWQVSPAGQNNWTDFPGGLLPNTTIYGGIQEAKDYRYVVTCGLSGETSTSGIIQVGMSTNCYCVAESNCAGPGGLQINNVQLQGETIAIDNPSGCGGGGYSDYRMEFPPDLEKGEIYTLSVTANNSNLMDDKLRAWIDFNQNNVFEPNELVMDYHNGFNQYTMDSNFTVPTNINSGLYRMRVRIGWWGAQVLNPCNAIGWGETEDYLVEVIPGNYPDQCPQPSNISVTQGDDVTKATVTWTAGGSETKWELVYGEVGFDPTTATPISVNGTTTYVLEELLNNTSYEVYVRTVCNANLTSDWEGPKVFTTGGLGLNDWNFEGFSYYPVPVETKLNLKSFIELEEVEIYNLSGKSIFKQRLSSANAELDLRHLPSGVYILKVQANGKVKSFKLIKK